MNALTAYAPHSRKLEEEKENFWNELFHLVSCIPQNEMVVLAGDMNGHVESNSVGYDGMHGGYGFGDRNADGSRILEFVDGLNLQYIVHEAGIYVGDLCSWFCHKYS